MKTVKLLLITCFLLTITVNAQVGIGTVTPDASASLDVESTNTGILIPRVDIADLTTAAPITAPVTSLLVYNTNTTTGQGFYYWNSTLWTPLSGTAASNDWSMNGNTASDPTVNFIGTTDAQDLIIRTNDTEAIRVHNNQNVSIGSNLDNAKLRVEVDNTDTTTNAGIFNYQNGVSSGLVDGISNYNYNSTNSSKYGIYNVINNLGTGARYGIDNNTSMNTASNAFGVGIQNSLNSYGTGNHYGINNSLGIFGTTTSDNNYGIYNNINVGTSTYNGDIYSTYNNLDYSAGNMYGTYKSINSNSAANGAKYGDYNLFEGNGTGLKYGYYNSFESTDSSLKTGIYNHFGTSSGTKSGIRNYLNINNTATGIVYGMNNHFVSQTGTSTKYGTYNNLTNNNGYNYGTYNFLSQPSGSTGNLYGTYTSIIGGASGLGSHYGIYSSVPGGTNDYAAMFYAGNVVANEAGQDYDFRIETDNREHAFYVDANEDLIRIGDDSTFSDYLNGSDIDGDTVDYVADFDNGNADGTAIGIGSVEFLFDGLSFTRINNSFGSTNNITHDLGTNTVAWRNVYASGFVTVSDEREKKNIENLDYGLAEVMAMRPVSYKLKKDPFQGVKIGLIAQEALALVPEAVKTHDYKVLDEVTPNTFTKVEMDRMGMNYSTLVPVLIKAVQEQQEQIKTLQETVGILANRLKLSEEVEKVLPKQLKTNNKRVEKILAYRRSILPVTKTLATPEKGVKTWQPNNNQNDNIHIEPNDALKAQKQVKKEHQEAVKAGERAKKANKKALKEKPEERAKPTSKN